jgi:hypothetical protein
VAIAALIGPLASSGPMVQHKADRERFIRKYSEMHQLSRERDGTTVLYVGAENWPFPVPLVSKAGKWRFDIDAGTREIMFRRIGENETSAIEACRLIARSSGVRDAHTSDTAIAEYVQRIAGAANPPAEAFHGYRFQLRRTSAADVVVAYPSEYGSTGVMTFAIDTHGAVYEKDLGPKTAELAQAMTHYKPDRTWHVAEP